MRIYLLGFMGCGKSHTGKKLAQLLDCPVIDLDTLIEEQAGMEISEIFAREGEKSFRLREQKALHETAKSEHLIIACGGGAPCFFDNMNWMKKHGLTVYLQTSVETLVEHLLPGREHRPLIAALSEEELPLFIEKKLFAREPVYLQAQIVFSQKIPFENIAEALKEEIEFISKA